MSLVAFPAQNAYLGGLSVMKIWRLFFVKHTVVQIRRPVNTKPRKVKKGGYT